jgi:hypothetical protein
MVGSPYLNDKTVPMRQNMALEAGAQAPAPAWAEYWPAAAMAAVIVQITRVKICGFVVPDIMEKM